MSAGVLFDDDFSTRGIPGWTAVQPPANYSLGPLRWQYDIVSQSLVEQSDLLTANNDVSPLLVNDTVVSPPFTFKARMTAGDDDGFGLVFGYQNPTNLYRVTFGRQARSFYPWQGWCVDRKVNGVTTNLFGAGTANYATSFINKANQAFDVTLTVDAANQLTLAVADNPTGTVKNYVLVSNQPLPSIATGQVGVLTWGMYNGIPRGFRIGNLDLAPVPLSGNPNSLTNFTPVLPPRADGSTNLSGGQHQALWSIGQGVSGGSGRLFEESASLAGNIIEPEVGFTGPTLVFGSPTWSNYSVAARIYALDAAANGVLVRYQNPSNFVRVVMRSGGPQGGPPPGLSIQKCSNGQYTELFREPTPQFEPVSTAPFDLIVAVFNDTLSVSINNNPRVIAQMFNYGIFNLNFPTLTNGQAGLFALTQSRTDFDSVTVQNDSILQVSSLFGTPSPSKGLRFYTNGSLVTASAGPPVITNHTRRFPINWTGSGIQPLTNLLTNLTFVVNGFSFLEWQWRTEYLIAVTNQVGGTVTRPASNWFNAGTPVALEAQPQPGFVFSGWSGTSFSMSNRILMIMDQPINLVAKFSADSDGDGLPDDWEVTYFGSTNASPLADPDGDGTSNFEEFKNRTNPLQPDILRLDRLTLLADRRAQLSVSNNWGNRYDLQMCSPLGQPWVTLGTAQYSGILTSSLPDANAFFRLKLPAVSDAVPPFQPGAWSLAILPDTQGYAAFYPELFQDQTRWLAQNRERYNIKYVLHLGDIVEENIPSQWSRAQAAMNLLDGQVPYAFCIGNHEYPGAGHPFDRTTLLNNYFPATKFLAWPTLGGLMESNKMENSYHRFSAGGTNWLVLSLEYGPRAKVITWAKSIIQQNTDCLFILLTHAYLYHDGTRLDRTRIQTGNPYSDFSTDPEGTSDGEDLWQQLIKTNRNFALVVSGHILGDGLGYLASTNNFGQVVHQMLVNYQMKPMGGEAYLRLLEFQPDGRTVQVKTYSPYHGNFKTDADNQFDLQCLPPWKP